jgi:hypothetical protein
MKLDALYEQMLLTPCRSKEELNQWIKTFFGIPLPDYTLDEDSTSSPMQFVWDVYETALTGKRDRTTFVVAASRNSCKCLKEGTLVATPQGPVEIQNLKPGDTVYDENGNPVKVTAVHDQGVQDCVDLINSRHTIATCTKNHIWLTCDTRTPDKLIERKTSELRGGVRIKRVTLEMPLGSKREPLAYALGALLGDGCSTECGVRISSENSLIPTKVAEILGTFWTKMKGNYTYIIRAPKKGPKWAFSDFYEDCIRGRKAHEKLANLEEIKTWDRQSLVEFVAGLMDTDGSVYITRKTGFQLHINFGVQSKSMVDAFVYACQALWQFTPTIYISNHKHYVNGPLYYVKINHAYYSKRILKELTPHIVTERKKYKEEYDSIESNNFNEEGYGVKLQDAGRHRCWDITVDSPTSLYCLYNGAVTHNTLSVAILEVLLMLHFGRDIIHMAAILDQSLAAVGYINKFMRTPAIQKYSVTDNKRVKALNKLPLTDLRGSENATLKVLVASKDSSNAQHASVLCYDELDLLEKRVLSESAMIGDPDRTGKPPIFIYLSSRKSASGPIQEKINQSADPKYGIALHKWSVADIMIPCPEDVHRPDLPEVSQWVHKESLEIKQEEEMKHLPPMHLDMYEEVKAFSGCVNCAAFLVCKGRSVRQKSQPSSILRDIPFVRTILRETGDPEQVKAQILNLKPESSGVVFNKFDKSIHCKNLPEAYKFAFGVDANVPFFTKQSFIRELAANGWRLTCGVDFGYTDPAAAVLVAYHRGLDKCIILHTEMSPGFSNMDWLMYVKSKIYDQFGFDLLCPDTADRSAPGIASKLGMPARSKKPSKIETGVSWIRARLWSPARQTYGLIVVRDGTTDAIITAFEQWQYRKGPMGFLFGEFETDSMPTHCLDACRYGIDPYVMAGVVQSSARMGDLPGTLLNPDDAQRVLTSVEASLSTKENFQEAMSMHYQYTSGIQLTWPDAQKMDNSRDKDEQPLQRTGNFIYSF